MDEEKLIMLVQKYPCLYDMASPIYSDHQRKENAWEEIAKIMSSNPDDCKKKWTRLRENYRKALKQRDSKPSGSGAAHQRSIRSGKELSFLNSSLKHASTISNVSSTPEQPSDHVTSDTESTANPIISKRKRSPEPKNLADVLDNFLSTQAPVQKPDNIDIFFNGIAETVKTFPKELQIQIKRKNFVMVNDAEDSLHNANNNLASMDTSYELTNDLRAQNEYTSYSVDQVNNNPPNNYGYSTGYSNPQEKK